MKAKKIKQIQQTKTISGLRSDYIATELMQCTDIPAIQKQLAAYLQIKKGVFAKIGGFFCYSSAEQRFKARFRALSESLWDLKVKGKIKKNQKIVLETQLGKLIHTHFDVKTLLTKLLQNHQLTDIKEYIEMNQDFFLFKGRQLNPYCFGENPHWYCVLKDWFEI